MSMFTEPSRVRSVVEQMRQSDWPRAQNRARIDSLFNGDPPYTAQECVENGIFTNVNFLEGTTVIQRAYQQFSAAILGPKEMFNVTVLTGDPAKRNDWSQIITSNVNRKIKRTQRYISTVHGQLCQGALHGISPVTFPRDGDWCPTLRGVGDVLVPGRTLTDMENLTQFCVVVDLTAGELLRYTEGPEIDPGWNLPLVKHIVKELARRSQEGSQSSTIPYGWPEPEKVEQDYKANGGYWSSDVVQTIRCYDFYFQEQVKEGSKWVNRICRRMICDDTFLPESKGEGGDQWLYNPKARKYGTEWNQCLHALFADGSIVAPFQWHTVRSLGFLLYAVCHEQNRLRCKFNDAVHESMMWYFRNVAAGDEERLQRIVLNNMGIIPEGVAFIGPNERHIIDPTLLSGAFAQNEALISSHSMAFRGGTGTSDNIGEPISATQAALDAQSSQAMLNGMLAKSYGYMRFQYQEVMRRFLTLDHPDCVAFRTECLKKKVPKEVLNIEALEVIPQQAMGAGNKAIEGAQAAFLVSIFDRLPSESQPKALHIITEAGTNADVADMLAPVDNSLPSEAEEVASLAWGTLVDGQPVKISRGLDKVGYVTTLMQMLSRAIKSIQANGNMPTMERVVGLANVVLHIEEILKPMANDEGKVPFVTMVNKALTVVGNELRGYVQRIEEQQQAGGQGGPDPEIIEELMKTKNKLEIKAAASKQQREQRDVNFMAEQARKDAGVQAQIAREDVNNQAAIIRQNALHNSEVEREANTPATE